MPKLKFFKFKKIFLSPLFWKKHQNTGLLNLSNECESSVNKAYQYDHNMYRAKHNTRGLQFSSELTKIA